MKSGHSSAARRHDRRRYFSSFAPSLITKSFNEIVLPFEAVMSRLQGTLMPFLYPCLTSKLQSPSTFMIHFFAHCSQRRSSSTESATDLAEPSHLQIFDPHLDPPPSDYGRTIFADKASLKLQAGSGGHGCISFLREKYIAAGPANGGDGGGGGNIYIQAVNGETSLHKLARRGILKAGRGRNGQGKSKGGQRGEDVLLQVPVGTVVREISRFDPVEEDNYKRELAAGMAKPIEQESDETWKRDKWILYPSSSPSHYATAETPVLPKPRRPALQAMQPPAPILLDLSEPMEQPLLLAAGAVGGLGNPHFITKSMPRPKYATKGEMGMTLELELELKLLADVGFVGLPNAGKSTLLRALSRSRARVGNWAFTTLQPNIGTVVLDSGRGRPAIQAFGEDGHPRTQFSVADIPGLIPGAHLDRGLGLGFLRHIERARVLAFVVDLSADDAIQALENLWKELEQFESLKERETNTGSEHRIVDWRAFGSSVSSVSAQDAIMETGEENFMINASGSQILRALNLPPISSKPWFVVATKADLESTQQNFVKLQAYLVDVASGKLKHPSGKKNGWKGHLVAIPVSAIRGEGVERIPKWILSLLKE